MVKTLICTGCSLSLKWTYAAENTIEHDNFFKYSFGGSGNEFQAQNLLNHYLKHGVDSSTQIVTQFTGMTRRMITMMEYNKKIPDTYQTSIVNAITDETEYHVFEHGENQLLTVDKGRDSGMYRIRDLVAIHCMLADLGADVRVFRGWLGVFPAKYWNNIKEIYDKHGVTYTDETYMETAISINSDPSAWQDELHPGGELAQETFAEIWRHLNER